DDAKAAYKGALGVKPTKPYPKQQLALIDKALAAKNGAQQKLAQQKNAEVQFDSLVKVADAAFKTKDYTTAKENYTSAQTLKPARPYPRQQLAAIEKLLAAKPTKKPPVKKDSIAKKAPDTAKVIEAPAVAVTVCPCEIKKLTDSCRVRLKPFQYDGTNALHLPLLPVSQEKEISLPGFSGQRYRIIINISAMPPGTIVAIYDQDKTHKKRKLLYTLTDQGSRIGFLDSECKSGKFFIDYEIPAKDKKYPPQGCAVILFGFETRN
ncbi:MAG TPA: hypothetical protein VNZ45_00075, partial [Bacteroidia bacterium]|nr:hypothetical protein [Bacteroidia bacterium]